MNQISQGCDRKSLGHDQGCDRMRDRWCDRMVVSGVTSPLGARVRAREGAGTHIYHTVTYTVTGVDIKRSHYWSYKGVYTVTPHLLAIQSLG